MNAKKHDCFPKDKSYSKFELNLDLIKLKYLEEIDEKKTIIALIILYVITALLIFCSIKLTYYNYLFYVPCIFLIAGRIGAFVQLAHEASHLLVSKNQKFNDFFGNYFENFKNNNIMFDFSEAPNFWFAHLELELEAHTLCGGASHQFYLLANFELLTPTLSVQTRKSLVHHLHQNGRLALNSRHAYRGKRRRPHVF